jgi:8-oxo-dGTP diphosphatase
VRDGARPRPDGVLVRAVVVREGLVLLVQRSADEEIAPNVWQCPGGTLEDGETPERTLRRELAEETGLAVSRAVLVASRRRVLESDRGPQLWEQHEYLVEVGPGEVRLSAEHQASAWVPIDEAEAFDGLSPFARRAIGLARRTLDGTGR